MTNCVNCGAPLNGDKCIYCGTTYSGGNVYANFSLNDCVGKLKLGDEEIEVYIGQVESRTICGNAYRDGNGVLHRDKPKMLRKFTVIEI